MTTILSCGILLESPEGWLLAHATGTNRWDIPKGRMEPGELPMQTALRETLEEIGIDLSDHAHLLVDLGRHPYIPRKDLHLFHLKIDSSFDPSHCRCLCSFEKPDGSVIPETDDFAWIPKEQVRQFVGKGLRSYLEKRGLLERPRSGMRPG